MKKKIFTRNDTPIICLTDNELSLIKKFKNYFFIIVKTEDDTTFYILRDRGSTDIDTTDYFGVSFSFEDGVPMIYSIFSNKTKFTLKYSIETRFHNIASFTPSGNTEEVSCISVHWPEPIDDDDEDEDDEGVEVQCMPAEGIIDPYSIPPKPFWQQSENIGPLNHLKSVEDN